MSSSPLPTARGRGSLGLRQGCVPGAEGPSQASLERRHHVEVVDKWMLLKSPSDRGWRASRPIRGDSWQGPAGPHDGGMSSGVHALCFGAVHGLTERLSEWKSAPSATQAKVQTGWGLGPMAHKRKQPKPGQLHAFPVSNLQRALSH